MNFHLAREIEKIKKDILTLSSEVEDSLNRSVLSIVKRDPDMAQEVIDNDSNIDRLEVALEEECLKVLALHQPVAIDLRYIIAVLKINSDLERIGDLSVNIAKQAKAFSKGRWPAIPEHIQEMTQKVHLMLEKSLESLINLDDSIAADVCRKDTEVDNLHKFTFKVIEQEIQKKPDSVLLYLGIGSISRYLERIADHATNIAEDVIYMVRGKIQRHDYEKIMEK